MPSTTPWLSVGAGILIGVVTNVHRATSVFACQELEAYGSGSAGVVGNILHAEYIAIMAFFALAFFGEKMSAQEIIGAAVIGASIIGVTGVKTMRRFLRKDTGDEEGTKKEAEEEERGDAMGEEGKQVVIVEDLPLLQRTQK